MPEALSMRPLSILHVTPYAGAAWAYGGIARVAGTLTRELARLGHRVTICTTDACSEHARLPRSGQRLVHRDWPAAVTADGVTVRVFPNVSNRLAYAQLFLPIGLSRFLRDHAGAFDIAHLHACRNVPGAMASAHLTRLGVPYVLAPNGTAPRIERRRTAKRVFDLLAGRRTLAGAARIVAVSRAEARTLAAGGIASASIRQIPNPIDLDEVPASPARGWLRQRYGLGDGPLVLFLGQISPRKRVDLLVRALAGLRAPHPGVRLVVAGNDQGAAHAVRVLARRLDVADRVTFTGLLSGPDRLAALADADAVAYPSDHEVFGLVPLEALLCGAPVVVTGDSGCGEVIGPIGGGLVVPAGDTEALTQALRTVLDHPVAWRSRAAEAAGRVRALYGGPVVAREIAALYEDVVERAS
jgi:glycosyltransferase involved in cell wall biosynthesis